jgi:hypothetical protein
MTLIEMGFESTDGILFSQDFEADGGRCEVILNIQELTMMILNSYDKEEGPCYHVKFNDLNSLMQETYGIYKFENIYV